MKLRLPVTLPELVRLKFSKVGTPERAKVGRNAQVEACLEDPFHSELCHFIPGAG
jgi:hypothetical protein